METVGKFPQRVGSMELGRDGILWEEKSAVPDARYEFANRIGCDINTEFVTDSSKLPRFPMSARG